MSTVFDVSALNGELINVQSKLNDENIYLNQKLYALLNKQYKNISEKLNLVNALTSRINNLNEFLQLCEQEDDINLLNDCDLELEKLEKIINELYLKTLLNGEYDQNNCIVKIHSGAGGTEACDWVEMLFRMYKMYCDKKSFKCNMVNFIEGDGAGFKSVTLEVNGDFAYGYLRGENGVHRLVRISPFDANKRRHTSFASVEVMPVIDEDESIELDERDLKIDTYRSSGAGGQHVNTTDSAIRITHLPTGVVVTCQNERSQIKNKATALKILKSKLLLMKIAQQKQSIKDLKGDEKKIEWGSQIRSYVFCPYKLVKDNRTNFETSNLDEVMNGGLDGFVLEYLKQQKVN